MKKIRMLSLMLAFCLGVGVLWYGCIAGLQKGSCVRLETVKGDPAALEGIPLSGTMEDQLFRYRFTLQNGLIQNEFEPKEYESLSNIDPDNNICEATVIAVPSKDAEVRDLQLTAADENSQSWELYTNRVKLMLAVSTIAENSEQEELAMVDTGIEINAGEKARFVFQNYVGSRLDAWRLVGWLKDGNKDEFIQDFYDMPFPEYGYCVQIGEKLYAAINLPGGGAQIYQVTDRAEYDLMWEDGVPKDPDRPIEEQLLEQAELGFPEIGKAELICEYPSQQVTGIIGMYQLEDSIAVLTYKDGVWQGWHLDEQNQIAANESSGQSAAELLVYDQAGNLQEKQTLMQFSGKEACQVAAYPVSSEDKKELCLKLQVQKWETNTHTDLAEKAFVLRMEPDGVNVLQSDAYALKPEGRWIAEKNGAAQLILAAEDPSGERMALLWQPFPADWTEPNPGPSGRDLYLQVIAKNGVVLYLGELKCGWEDDVRHELSQYDQIGLTFNTNELPRNWRHYSFENAFERYSSEVYNFDRGPWNFYPG